MSDGREMLVKCAKEILSDRLRYDWDEMNPETQDMHLSVLFDIAEDYVLLVEGKIQ